MLLFMKKKLYGPLSWMGLNESHFEEAVYFLPLSSQKLLVLIFYQLHREKTTQILKSDPKKGVSVVTKMLFPQVDEGFWLYYTSFWYKNI